MSQKDAVAHLLLARGHVHTFELRRGDAGEMIGNPSERIAELERDGWVFEHTREKLHGKATGTRYRLLSAPGVERDAPRPASPGAAPLESGRVPLSPGGRLFDTFDLDCPASVPHWKAG